MIYLLAGLNVAGWLAGTYMVLKYLRERDQSERLERAVLLQRIQAPEEAVREHGLERAPESREMVEPPLTDDQWWEQEYARREAMDRMDQLGAEMAGMTLPLDKVIRTTQDEARRLDGLYQAVPVER